MAIRKLTPGVRVSVVEGSGLHSLKEGIILDATLAENRPYTKLGYQGRYSFFDIKRERLIKADDGEVFAMFANRLVRKVPQ